MLRNFRKIIGLAELLFFLTLSVPAPAQETHPLPLSGDLSRFINNELMPTESQYFQPGVGLDPLTGMPFDHIRVRLKSGMLGEMGNYTAASKLSLSIPFLLKVIQRRPEFRKVKMKPDEAEKILKRTLQTLLKYTHDYPDYEGFLPWVDIRPNGTIAPANTKVPSLDNGQMTWALAAVVAGLENSSSAGQREIAALAAKILSIQNYRKFYDEKAGLLNGTIQKDPVSGEWVRDQTYFIDDMFEGILAVLWGVLNGQVPEEAWYNLKIPTVDYITENGEKATTFKGFRASFHEHWALGYLPVMDSSLSQLYRNYLYVQSDYANKRGLPGFLSTAYDACGTYRQMGIPEISQNPVDRSDVSVVFATAMAMLISPRVGAAWLKKIYTFQNVVNRFGAVESVGTDGYADIFTADAKGMTLLAASGGVINETRDYLMSRSVPRSGVPMYAKLMELLHAKYKQMQAERGEAPLYVPSFPYAMPPEKTIKVQARKLLEAGDTYDISAHLQKGHLHGKNVFTLNRRTLEDDVRPGQPFQFHFEIQPNSPYFDQWAFRGTYVDQAVRIADMSYLSVTIPAQSPPMLYEIELKSDDISLASALIDTTLPGVLSENATLKTITAKIDTIPDADYKPFNYFAIALHDPAFLSQKFAGYSRSGQVVAANIKLSRSLPAGMEEKNVQQAHNPAPGFKLLRYWRISHGNLKFETEDDGSYRFKQGSGWRGGYLPYTDLTKFRYMYLLVRNPSSVQNSFKFEIKHEHSAIMGYKMPIFLKSREGDYLVEIAMPSHPAAPLNYFALSDPQNDVILKDIFLTQNVYDPKDIKKVHLPKAVYTSQRSKSPD